MLTITKVRSILKRCVFNIKDDPAMRIISDVGSQEYYRHRAIESIHKRQYIEAIRLLVILIYEINENNKTKKTRKNNTK